MKTSQQIRQALIQIAEKNNRPHYTAIVVRAVLEALKNSTYHPLVDQVNSHIDQIMPLSGQYSEKNDSPCELEPKEKNCSLCDESFPETKEFFFGRNLKFGYKFDSYCKACYKQRYKRSQVRTNNLEHRYTPTEQFRKITEKYCGNQSVQGGAV